MVITLTLPRLLTLPPTIFLHLRVLEISSKVWIAKDGCKGDICGSRSGAALCRTQSVPDSFTVDTSQDTAKPVKSFWHLFENAFKKGQRQDRRRKGRPKQ